MLDAGFARVRAAAPSDTRNAREAFPGAPGRAKRPVRVRSRDDCRRARATEVPFPEAGKQASREAFARRAPRIPAETRTFCHVDPRCSRAFARKRAFYACYVAPRAGSLAPGDRMRRFRKAGAAAHGETPREALVFTAVHRDGRRAVFIFSTTFAVATVFDRRRPATDRPRRRPDRSRGPPGRGPRRARARSTVPRAVQSRPGSSRGRPHAAPPGR